MKSIKILKKFGRKRKIPVVKFEMPAPMWGDPFEEATSLFQVNAAIKRLEGQNFHFYIYKLSAPKPEQPEIRYYLYILKS